MLERSSSHWDHSQVPTKARLARRGRIPGQLLRGRWGPLVIHCLIAAPVLLAAWLSESPGPTLLIGAILALVGYPIVVILEMRLTPLVLDPLGYFFAWQWLVLGLAGLWKSLDVLNGTKVFHFSTAMVSSEDLASGYAIYQLGLLAFHLGVTILRPVARPDQAVAEARLPEAGYGLLWLAGILTRVLRAPLSWMGSALGILSTASSAALCAIAIRGEPGQALPKRSWLLLLAGSAVEFVAGLLGNSKGMAMLALVPFAWQALRSRRPARNVAAFVAAFALLYGAIVYPLVSAARGSGDYNRAAGGYSLSAILTAQDEASRDRVDWSQTADSLFDRVFAPTPVGFLVAQVREFGQRHGETMDYLLYAFVPRAIWPDKPIVSRGGWFHVYLGGSSRVEDATTSLGQTAAGELLWNFGIPGVLLGLLASGLLFGWLWALAGVDPRNSPLRMLLYLNLLLGAPGYMESEWGSGFVGLIYRAVIFAVLLKLGSRRGKGRPARTTAARTEDASAQHPESFTPTVRARRRPQSA